MPSKWTGSVPRCDICEQTTNRWFVDGATKMGPWAIMCPTDFKSYGRGLGPGLGQKYNAQTLEKMEG
jgi:hypothetical protein